LKVKGKFHPTACQDGKDGECMYRSNFLSTSAIDGVGG